MREQFTEMMKASMKAGDKPRLATVRMIMAALKDRDIAARSKGNKDGIGEPEILALLQAMVKQRRESAELYEKGGRPELAQQTPAAAQVLGQGGEQRLEFATRLREPGHPLAQLRAPGANLVAEVGGAPSEEAREVLVVERQRRTRHQFRCGGG